VSPGGIERERKFAGWGGFELPPLDALDDGVVAVPLPEQQLDATYYDTADLRLARAGVTVRFRTGEARPTWTVKLPGGDAGPALARREIDVPGSGRVVPSEVAALVRAHVRGALLAPVGTLSSRRRRVQLRRADGAEPLLEIADDEVSVLEGRRVALRFREIEVEELAEGVGGLAAKVGDALLAAGAAPSEQTPKIVRVLGPRALAPAVGSGPELGEGASVSDVVRAAIAAGFRRIVQHDPGIRLGGDAEDVHQARVAARRLRSDLRTFRTLLDPDRAGPLRDELQWLGGELGHVRDADVLDERLRRQLSTLPAEDSRAGAALLRRLDTERAAARAELLQALSEDRYVRLLDALVAAVDVPPLLADAEADAPARRVLPSIVRGPWKHLQKAVESLDPHPEDEALHEIRIRAKRTRYAAEAAAPVLGKPAAKFAKAVAGVQTVLGDLQDAVVAEAWLRTAGGRGPAAQALVAGELIAVQRQAMADARRDWPAAWDEVAGKKLRAWLA
jgi:CHAD domain-containing protein